MLFRLHIAEQTNMLTNGELLTLGQQSILNLKLQSMWGKQYSDVMFKLIIESNHYDDRDFYNLLSTN